MTYFGVKARYSKLTKDLGSQPSSSSDQSHCKNIQNPLLLQHAILHITYYILQADPHGYDHHEDEDEDEDEDDLDEDSLTSLRLLLNPLHRLVGRDVDTKFLRSLKIIITVIVRTQKNCHRNQYKSWHLVVEIYILVLAS